MKRISEQKVLLSTRWCDFVAKTVEGDDSGPWYNLSLGSYTIILAVTDAREILMVRQFRPAIEANTLELPSGQVDDGESPEATAFRELREETGYRARSMELHGVVNTDAGRLDNHIWCYFTDDLECTGPPEDDFLELIKVPESELMQMIGSGEFCQGLCFPSLFHALVRGKIALG